MPGMLSVWASSNTDWALSVTGPYESTAIVTGPIPRKPNATRPNANTAAALFAGVFELMSIAFALVSEWVLRHDQYVRDPMSAAAKKPARLSFYAGQVPYLIAFVVAFFNVWATVAITAATGIYYIFVRTYAPPTPTAPASPPE